MQFHPEPEPEPLFDLCLSAHMCVSGSSDAISDEQLQQLLTELKQRRDNWKPSSECTKAFDDAVYAVLQASIAEAEAYLAEEDDFQLTASHLDLTKSFSVESKPTPTPAQAATLYTDGASGKALWPAVAGQFLPLATGQAFAHGPVDGVGV